MGFVGRRRQAVLRVAAGTLPTALDRRPSGIEQHLLQKFERIQQAGAEGARTRLSSSSVGSSSPSMFKL